jgi:hypothetical protein
VKILSAAIPLKASIYVQLSYFCPFCALIEGLNLKFFCKGFSIDKMILPTDYFKIGGS